VAVILLFIGLSYNLVFAEELFHGKINGSASRVLAESVAYIDQNTEIQKVLTYNDTGAGPLSLIGRYAGRIYATPDAEDGYRKKFSQFDGHYLVVGMPPLYAGFYSDFFAKCDTLFETRSGTITGRVYSCAQVRP
jgi:hypothetical protein